MKEDTIIYQLKQLKKLEPSQETLSLLKKEIFSHIDQSEYTSLIAPQKVFYDVYMFWQERSVFVYVGLIILLLCSSVIFKWDTLSKQPQIIITQVQITFASNTYKKAQLALTLSQKELSGTKVIQEKSLVTQITYLSNSTSQTNKLMSNLNLMGEPGKYTKQQCLDIYRQYYAYLVDLRGTVENMMGQTTDETTQKELQSLLNQTFLYKQQAETKLSLY